HQDTGETLRQRLDDGDFERKPPVCDKAWQRVALLQKGCGAPGQPGYAAAQFRRRLGRTERLDAKAARGEGIKRDIDAVEVTVVGCAILQVVDDLQRRADGIGRGPRAAALAVHVEHETPDW